MSVTLYANIPLQGDVCVSGRGQGQALDDVAVRLETDPHEVDRGEGVKFIRVSFLSS